MTRVRLGWILCAGLLAAGLATAGLASANRARGDELDRLERWCETQARRNVLARTDLQRREFELSGQGLARGREAAP